MTNNELMAGVKNLLHCVFRFNPNYRYVSFQCLAIDDWKQIGAHVNFSLFLRGSNEMCGVLIPSIPLLSFKAVNLDTSNLIECLKVPGLLPETAAKIFEENVAMLLRLLLDCILEVKGEHGFISGASILDLIKLKKVGDPRCHSLSLEALKYGQALECNYAPALSDRLYFYNRKPMSPRWSNRIASEADYARFVGIEPGTEIYDLLNSKWISNESLSTDCSWLKWYSPKYINERVHLPYKIYLSPVCEDLKDALRICIPIITDFEIPVFKLGNGPRGILRPDKFVIYLSSGDKLRRLTDTLARELRGIRAHGIPFASVINSDGLVSWGMDPPRSHLLSSYEGTSWRRWVTDQLAVALLIAKNGPDDATVSPWEFALHRITIEGVNTENWAPFNVPWMWKEYESN